MKHLTRSLVAAFAFTTAAFAADKYQVTGPIVELTDKVIVVEKGKDKERFEVARTADTKVTGELKVGAKVTVFYTMTASAVEVKK
jgi:hypothetical protein